MNPTQCGAAGCLAKARRLPAALQTSCAAILAVIAMSSVLEAGEPLARVRYLMGERELQGIGELLLEPAQQVRLRLFNDSIAGEYALYMRAEDILEVEYLGAVEVEAELARREQMRKQAEARRAISEADLGRRRAEDSSLKAKPGAGGSDRPAQTGKKQRSDPRAKSAKKPRKSEQQVASIEETMGELAQTAGKLQQRLSSVADCNEKLLASVRGYYAAQATHQKARRWLNDLEGLKEELAILSEALERRIGDIEKLRLAIEGGESTRHEVREEADVVLRMLAPVESKLAKAEAKCENHKSDLEALPAAEVVDVSVTPVSAAPGKPTSAKPVVRATEIATGIAVKEGAEPRTRGRSEDLHSEAVGLSPAASIAVASRVPAAARVSATTAEAIAPAVDLGIAPRAAVPVESDDAAATDSRGDASTYFALACLAVSLLAIVYVIRVRPRPSPEPSHLPLD